MRSLDLSTQQPTEAFDYLQVFHLSGDPPPESIKTIDEIESGAK